MMNHEKYKRALMGKDFEASGCLKSMIIIIVFAIFFFTGLIFWILKLIS